VYLGVHDRAKLSSDSGAVVRSVKNILRVWMKQGGDRLRQSIMCSSNLIKFYLISITFHLIQSNLSNRNQIHLI
jgi:hypothetical protein